MKNFNLLLKICCFAVLAQLISCGKSKLSCSIRADKDYRIMKELISLRKEAAEVSKHIERLQSELQAFKEAETGAAGDTYIRWGRTTCPGNGTSLVYTGFMAGAYKTHSGTGTNYICLTDTPLWEHYNDFNAESFGKITGTEYRFYRHNGAADFFGDNMSTHVAPCAVCHTQKRISAMFPGTNKCFDGWRMEYNGYLVSGSHDDKASTKYTCLDRRPEKVPNGSRREDIAIGNRLYLVEAVCGQSLPCPNYRRAREVTCAVCSA